MRTEITTSKISQELRNPYTQVEWPELKKLAADAIDELNQRLIERAEAAMERGKKDQEEIRKLNLKLMKLYNVIKDFINITEDSNGVAGFHRNGDVARWDEFDEIVEIYKVLEEMNPQKEGT